MARIGVIGLGTAGVMHAGHLAERADVDEVVLLGRDPERVEAARRRLGDTVAPVTTRTGSLTDAAASVDAVVVATSTPTHPALTLEAARAGLPVLVEKPLSLDLAELTALADELDDLGATVMVGFHRRYDPGHQELRRRVVAGDVGTVRLVHATGHDRRRVAPAYIPASGGIFLDMLVHDFDSIPWVLGERVLSVAATGSVLDAPVHAESGDVDTAAALLTLTSGALAVVTGARRNDAGQDVRLEVFGSEGTLAAGWDARTPVTSTEPDAAAPETPYEDYVERFRPAFRHEIERFLAVAFAGGENLTPPRAGMHALQVARAAVASRAAGGAPVRVERLEGEQS